MEILLSTILAFQQDSMNLAKHSKSNEDDVWSSFVPKGREDPNEAHGKQALHSIT